MLGLRRLFRSRGRRELLWGLVFISPGLTYFAVFWIAPVIMTVQQSLWRWKFGRATDYVGLRNYELLFTDPLFIDSVKATFWITFGALIACTVIAFGLAWLLNDSTLRGARWFRLIFFLPVITDWVATALVWQLIFLPYQGVLPGILYSLGLSNTSLPTLRWTSSRELAPVSIIIFTVWKTTGLYMVIYLAGLRSIPKELIEAARVDGAREWDLIRHVTLPLLSPISIFVILVCFVNSIGMFEPVWMLTGGGPAEATKTLPLFIHEAFFRFRLGGYASAAAIVFLFFTLLFAIIATWGIRMSAYQE
jgi:ABC-type sugar transport system permease subunit